MYERNNYVYFIANHIKLFKQKRIITFVIINNGLN